MLKAFKSLWNSERGNALIIAAASLPLIMGSAGLASDTIQWALWKRELQRAADSAAIAGVYAAIQDADYEDAVEKDLVHNNDVADFTIDTDIENSPSTGAYTADPMAVRVALAAQRELNFSSMFMQAAPTIRASATATIVPSGDYCVVSLESTAVTGISIGGAANVDLGCGMITNSTSMDAALAFGSSDVTASPIAAVGGIDSGSKNWGNNVQFLPFTMAQADPFENIDPPTPTGCQTFDKYFGPDDENKVGGTVDLSAQTGTICIKENGSGTLDFKGDIKLGAATYVFDATSLKMTTTSAKLSCDGCTIILTSDSTADPDSTIGTIDLSGGTLDLTAPSTGTYAGISIYQDRRAANGPTNKINGNNNSDFQGAFYLPNQELTFTGTSGVTFQCVQMVARRVVFSGTSDIENNCPANSGSSSFKGRTVRLVE